MAKGVSVVLAIAALAAMAACNFGPPLTPLISAAREGDSARIKELVKAGANPDERGGVNDWTPLMHAIHKNRIASVRALLDAGADANARYGDGETPLMMAAGYGQTDIVGELLARGADPRAKAVHGSTVLDMAVGGTPDIDDFTVGACRPGVVAALLASAPDLQLSSGMHGRVARLAARIGGCREVLALVEGHRAATVRGGSR